MHQNFKSTYRPLAYSGTLMLLLLFTMGVNAQNPKKAVLAYYSGSLERLDSFDVNAITHIVYCFGHLEGNKLKLGRGRDTLLIQKMVAMKQKNPDLKVLLSLGGWGGCKTCSEVFATEKGRSEFARSVKETISYFGADGIDLDWEYPSIPGYPGHPFSPADKPAFTELVRELRTALGAKKLVTFAAGGTQRYLDEAVNWKDVMPMVDYVNLMSYDLVGGYAKTTGHHTALFSNAAQKESTNNAVQYLLQNGVDPKKIIIGAAFYARVWEKVPAENNGLYQPGTFKTAIAYRHFGEQLSEKNGFQFYWDSIARAPYAYHPGKGWFATYDDKRSIAIKTAYVQQQNLGGIMFWELGSDTYSNGLLQTIYQTLKEGVK